MAEQRWTGWSFGDATGTRVANAITQNRTIAAQKEALEARLLANATENQRRIDSHEKIAAANLALESDKLSFQRKKWKQNEGRVSTLFDQQQSKLKNMEDFMEHIHKEEIRRKKEKDAWKTERDKYETSLRNKPLKAFEEGKKEAKITSDVIGGIPGLQHPLFQPIASKINQLLYGTYRAFNPSDKWTRKRADRKYPAPITEQTQLPEGIKLDSPEMFNYYQNFYQGGTSPADLINMAMGNSNYGNMTHDQLLQLLQD